MFPAILQKKRSLELRSSLLKIRHTLYLLFISSHKFLPMNTCILIGHGNSLVERVTDDRKVPGSNPAGAASELRQCR